MRSETGGQRICDGDHGRYTEHPTALPVAAHRQAKAIAAVYDEPQKVVSYLTRDYNRGMYRDVSHVMEQLEILHNSDGIELEIPRLQKPISRSHDFDLSL